RTTRRTPVRSGSGGRGRAG
ncbi:hypothetical protein KFL_001730070, partial [Klebsormidium nitens]